MTTGLGGADARIVGRERELDRIGELLGAGGGLLLEGEAGIGKTTLWRAAVELARRRGLCVLAAAPSEAERSFSYAVLGDLFGVVPDEVIGTLSSPQRRALERVLLKVEGDEAVDVRAVAVAVHSTLTALGAEQPVVVAIDDAQWVDAASAAALEFALRRATSVCALIAYRLGSSPRLGRSLERLEVGSLSVGAIHHMLVERLGRALPRPFLLRLHEVSGGNPFYALELARASPDARELVLPASLQDIVADRLTALPVRTRHALAGLALAGSPMDDSELAPAVEAGVLAVLGDSVRFSHPLLAEAAVGLLAPEARRALHREIADRATDAEQRARHLAKATQSRDEQVASALVEAAVAAARRSRIAAAELWELAASLTPHATPELISERLVEAGMAHVHAGNPGHGARLLEANADRLPHGTRRHRALVALARMAERRDMTLVIPVLERAAAEVTDLKERFEFVNLLCTVVSCTGGAAGAAAIARAYADEAEAASSDSAVVVPALENAAVFELSCDRPAWPLIERALELEPAREVSESRLAAMFALLRDGRIDEACALVEAALVQPELYSIHRYWSLVLNLAVCELAAGRLERAQSLADEGLTLGEQLASPNAISSALACSAAVAVLLGNSDQARELATRALRLAEEIGGTMVANHARYTLGLLELSLGRTAEAAAAYREVTPDGWARNTYWAGGRATLDAVEALSAVGDTTRAGEIAALLPSDARERPIAEACLAAAAGDLAHAIELVRSTTPSPAPFRHAGELLLLGRFLRQARQRTGAREALSAARDEFERLGARPWAERAQDELARLGGRTPAGMALTESERRVAELVATGWSNKEVAASLMVTVRTVEAHLSKIYTKLGVRSRTALAAHWHES